MQSSRKGRAPLSVAANTGSFALWPNAIRLRPNEHSSRWATINAGAKARIILSRSFGEGLLARMTKDEARARTAFEAARAQQEKIVQAQPDYGPALCVLGYNRRCSWAQRPGLGRRPSSDRAHAVGKRRQPTEAASFSISRSRQRGRATRSLPCSNWKLDCVLPSHRSGAELRRTKAAAFLGPAPRRSALRKNRHLFGSKMR